MKIVFDVETESVCYNNGHETRDSSGRVALSWDIIVTLDQKYFQDTDEDNEVVFNLDQVPLNSRKTSHQQFAGMRKVSSTSQLIERMGKGRKVSRQGMFLVFTEKYGLLTTQNGTQQASAFQLE